MMVQPGMQVLPGRPQSECEVRYLGAQDRGWARQKGQRAHPPPAPSTQRWDDASHTRPRKHGSICHQSGHRPLEATLEAARHRGKHSWLQAVQRWRQRTRWAAGPLLLLFRLERFIPILMWSLGKPGLWSLTYILKWVTVLFGFFLIWAVVYGSPSPLYPLRNFLDLDSRGGP